MRRQQELAESMAEFVEVGITSNSTGDWMYLGNKGGKVNPDDFFFDPEGNPPNPKGFQLVWDQLDTKEVYVKFHPFNKYVGEKYAYGVYLYKKDHPYGALSYLSNGSGPTRFHAFYGAVDAMRNGE